MIRSVDRLTTAAAGARAAALQRPSRTTSNGAKAPGDFQKIIKPAIATTTAATTTAPTGATSGKTVPAQLGPFVEGPFSTAAPAPPPAKVTSSPWLPAGTPGDQNLTNPAEHEATMNAWLQNYTQWTNDNKTQVYQQAMADWRINNQRCQDLGIAAPPQPTAPTLEAVQPKPAGWWFQFQG